MPRIPRNSDLTTRQAAEAIGVTIGRVHQLIKEFRTGKPKLRAEKDPNGRYYIAASEVRAFIRWRSRQTFPG